MPKAKKRVSATKPFAALIFFVALALCSKEARAQPPGIESVGPRLFVCIGYPTEIPTRSMPQGDTTAVRRDCQMVERNGTKVVLEPTTSQDLANRVQANTEQWVLVRFADSETSPTAPPANAGLQEVIVRAAGITVSRNSGQVLTNNTVGVPLKDFSSVPNAALVSVR
jgi:hypothetical protein